jgi:MFS family permease
MIVFLGANFVAMIFMTWVPLFLFEKFHLGLAQAGFTGSAFVNLAAAVSVPFGGRIADALARRYAGGRITTQALGLLGGSIFIVFVGLTGSLSILIVSISFFGLFKGLYDANIFASLYDVVEPRTRATAAGVMNAVGWCGGALGPVAAGFATQYGRHGSDMMANMSEAIALAAVIFALDGLLLIVALSTVRRDVDAALTCAV